VWRTDREEGIDSDRETHAGREHWQTGLTLQKHAVKPAAAQDH
jgi:hypothetical protein